MALLRRKKKVTTNIPELQEYYANQRKESTGLAWLLAIGSLIATVALLIGLFWGGRWLYRRINDKKDKTVSTLVSTDSSSQDKTADEADSSSTTESSSSSSSSNSRNSASSTSTTTVAPGVSPSQSASTNIAAEAATTTAKTVTDTGAGDTVGLFVVVMVAAYFAHRRYTLNRI